MNNDMDIKEKQHINLGSAENTTERPIFSPLVDIWESENNLTLVADMPGITVENLSIDLKDSTLTISAKITPTICPTKFLTKEYETGDFYRQFILSEHIDKEKITATIKNGVVTLTLPKLSASEPRKIKVTVE